MLIEKYETARYPILSPDPIEAIRFKMAQRGLTVKAGRGLPKPLAETICQSSSRIRRQRNRHLAKSSSIVLS